MDVSAIPLDQTGRFNRLILDYVNGAENLNQYYGFLHSMENYSDQIRSRKQFPIDRDLLVSALQTQYNSIGGANGSVLANILFLKDDNTFTVTTGHQLNIFTGPLYFIYKILHTIKLAEELRVAYPEFKFVPIYWMNSEDHDLDEIGQFNLFGKKYVWETDQTGATGRMQTGSLNELCSELSEVFSNNIEAQEIVEIFRSAYSKAENLAQATRMFCDQIFGPYGLVIIDSDDRDLKKSFVSFFKKDILQNLPYELVKHTNRNLSVDYHVQVNPREINCFYLSDGQRNRIVATETGFHVLKTEHRFSTEELENELESHPERFSPNVVLRPLFQEFVLPNLTYVGGAGELSYWLQYRDYFNKMGVSFPMLSLRNHFMIIDAGLNKRLEELELLPEDLFHSIEQLVKEHVLDLADTDIDLTDEIKLLSQLYVGLKKKAEGIDGSLIPSLDAEEIRIRKGLEQWSSRFSRALKQQNEVSINRLRKAYNTVFPNGYLQERHDNFLTFYSQRPTTFIEDIYAATDPFGIEFRIISFR
ncbi:MAG: hypothetical protein RL266_211 [Bacteroidota bacterium]